MCVRVYVRIGDDNIHRHRRSGHGYLLSVRRSGGPRLAVQFKEDGNNSYFVWLNIKVRETWSTWKVSASVLIIQDVSIHILRYRERRGGSLYVEGVVRRTLIRNWRYMLQILLEQSEVSCKCSLKTPSFFESHGQSTKICS